MKIIQRDRHFEKHYKKRIKPNKKLVAQFEHRLALFSTGVRDYPIDGHALTGKLAGKRSWSVANNIRVVYRETNDAIIFVDIGTHAQVYQ